MNGTGNQIGGDTPESENVITDFWYGAIWINTSNDNEMGRNRGTSTSTGFITTSNAIQPPTIAKAYPTKVSGTATAGAKVRVFAAANEGTGEIDGFLGEATANGSGEWSATITTVGRRRARDRHADVRRQHLAVGRDDRRRKRIVLGRWRRIRRRGGGPSSAGGTTTTTTPPPATTAPTATPAPTSAPTVKITRGPKKSSTATTARFTFKATPAAVTKFECKLDNFQVGELQVAEELQEAEARQAHLPGARRAGGVTGTAAKFKFTVKS